MAKLSFLQCACQRCGYRAVKKSPTGLCTVDNSIFKKHRVPVAGYISSFDLQKVAQAFFKDYQPTHSEVIEALAIMRGSRYPRGDWDKRPPYRVQPLLHRTAHHRLCHVLLGKRKAPSLRALGMGIVHHTLATSVIGAGRGYAQWLAGASYFGRRGLIAPSGVEIPKGNAKSAGYRLQRTDYTTIGRTCLKAGHKMGLHPDARWWTDRITSIYLEGVNAGIYHPPVHVSRYSNMTTASGDSPLDHFLPERDLTIPAKYRGKLRRASGKIAGVWPEDLDLSPEQLAAKHRDQHQARHDAQRVKTAPAPSTDWLFR